MALRDRDIVPGELIHHTDRGVQYACGDYIAHLEAAGIQPTPTMSRPGCPYDNAMAESFMKTLKAEEVNATEYQNIGHARSAIGKFLEEVYNRQRLHSALNYISPEEFELAALTAAKAASANLQP
jgi:putative transposase